MINKHDEYLRMLDRIVLILFMNIIISSLSLILNSF